MKILRSLTLIFITISLVVIVDQGYVDASPKASVMITLSQPNQDEINRFSVEVNGKANIFGAGKAAPPDPNGNGAGILPPHIRFNANTNQFVSFTSITGQISGWSDGCPFHNSDGGTGCGGGTNVSSWGGISGIRHNSRTMFLVGVFLSDAEPLPPAPPRLDASNSNALTQFSPQLDQVFFIGNGRNAAGQTQVFSIPTGATRLYLGFAETQGFNTSIPNPPGAYSDNGGALTTGDPIWMSQAIYVPVVVKP